MMDPWDPGSVVWGWVPKFDCILEKLVYGMLELYSITSDSPRLNLPALPLSTAIDSCIALRGQALLIS